MSEEGDETAPLASSQQQQQARKRRMERRGIKNGSPQDNSGDKTAAPARKKPKASATVLNKDALAKIPGVKKQARYVPVVTTEDGVTTQPVPMTKEELTLWRKEARRVRNRESAAASRQKTQGRIVELEAQVATLTSKYQAALAHIAELEEARNGGCSSSSSAVSVSSHGRLAPPASAATVWMPAKMSSDRAAVAQAAAATTVSPPLSPRDSGSVISNDDSAAAASSATCPPSQPLHWSLDNPQDQDALISSSLSVPFSGHPRGVENSPSSSSSIHSHPTSSSSSSTYQQRPSKISRPNACVKNPPIPRAVVIAI